MIQEFIFAAGSIAFTIALIPTVLGPLKPPRSTSALTGGVLWVFAITFATMGFWFSAAASASTAILWTIIFFQTRKTLDDLVDQLGPQMESLMGLIEGIGKDEPGPDRLSEEPRR